MALTLKCLMSGTLGTTADVALYQVTTLKSALVKNIILVNTHTAAIQVEMQMKRYADSSARYIAPKDLSIPAGGQIVLDAEITLQNAGSAPDEIRGWALVTASKIDYVINGLERDI